MGAYGGHRWCHMVAPVVASGGLYTRRNKAPTTVLLLPPLPGMKVNGNAGYYLLAAIKRNLIYRKKDA